MVVIRIGENFFVHRCDFCKRESSRPDNKKGGSVISHWDIIETTEVCAKSLCRDCGGYKYRGRKCTLISACKRCRTSKQFGVLRALMEVR